MAEPTLESLAKRIEELERKVAEQAALLARPTSNKNWLKVVGMFGDSEFMRQVDAEGQAIREADRKAALEGQPE